MTENSITLDQERAITTIYDTSGEALTIDRDIDHFFCSGLKRLVTPTNSVLWIFDNGRRRPLEEFVWEVWNGGVAPNNRVAQKSPGRDYRLQNLELVRIAKAQKSA